MIILLHPANDKQEDIWIDTVVLANYEFFSSMIRNFRISVSDRYPVKIDKWKNLGVFEARNSREIQAFLVENPQIWARYLRIEFINHYGNEYYCPLSLIRVHGTRMLESWKETESATEDEKSSEVVGSNPGEQYVPDAVAEVLKEEDRIHAEQLTATSPTNTINPNTENIPHCTSQRCVAVDDFTCTTEIRNELNVFVPHQLPQCSLAKPEVMHESETVISKDTKEPTKLRAASGTAKVPGSVSDSMKQPSIQSASHVASSAADSHKNNSIRQGTTGARSDVKEETSTTKALGTSKVVNSTVSSKDRISGTASSQQASPTQQESFFKAVTRRLQLLESSSTLSLKYIEDQSRILRDAFAKVEKRQLSKTTNFLQALNGSVIAELQGFRQQYDEIWQSTVISLQTQREESRKEILAISSRLNILADEVVFQKRISIVQSVLLLLCLGLVIFSRISAFSQVDSPSRNMMHERDAMLRARDASFYTEQELRYSRDWPAHMRHRSDSGESIDTQNCEMPYSPTTPMSVYSASDYTTTPLSARNTDPLSRVYLNGNGGSLSSPALISPQKAHNGCRRHLRRLHSDSSGSDVNTALSHPQTATPSLLRDYPSPAFSASEVARDEREVGAEMLTPTPSQDGFLSGSTSRSSQDHEHRALPSIISQTTDRLIPARKPLASEASNLPPLAYD